MILNCGIDLQDYYSTDTSKRIVGLIYRIITAQTAAIGLWNCFTRLFKALTARSLEQHQAADNALTGVITQNGYIKHK